MGTRYGQTNVAIADLTEEDGLPMPSASSDEPLESPRSLAPLLHAGMGQRPRKIAILAADGVPGASVKRLTKALEATGAIVRLVGPGLEAIRTGEGDLIVPDCSLLTASSAQFDGIYVADGDACARLLAGDSRAVDLVRDAFDHCKILGATGCSIEVLRLAQIPLPAPGDEDRVPGPGGVMIGSDSERDRVATDFVAALSPQPAWPRGLSVPEYRR